MQKTGPVLSEQDVKFLKALQEPARALRGGEVVVRSGAETGRIFFSRGKIAWAAASTIKTTFTKYLVEHTELSKDEIRAAFEECKRSGRNFGETILEWGLMEGSILRDLLLRHIAQMIFEMFTWSGMEALFMPEERAYKGNLTFDLREVLDTVLALDDNKKLSFSNMSAKHLLDSVEDRSYDWEDENPRSIVPQTASSTKVSKKKSRAVVWVLVLLAASVAAGVVYRGQLVSWLPVDLEEQPAGSALPTPEWIVTPSNASDTVDLNSTDSGHAKLNAGSVKEGTHTPMQSPEAGIDDKDPKVFEPEKLKASDDEPKKTPPRTATGSLVVTSIPSRAPVYLNGVYTGKVTPCTLDDLPVGVEHVVLLERRGRKPGFRTVKLIPGEKASLKLVLSRRGRGWKGEVKVRVVSEPRGAAIYLDGKNTRKKTPAVLMLRSSSASKLELRHAGFRVWTRTVRPIPGRQLVFSAEMQKNPQ